MKAEMIEEATARAIPIRKRPVAVEAMRFTPTGECQVAIKEWAGDQVTSTFSDEASWGITVHTLDGSSCVLRAGWWIIKGVEGEFYPCSADVFEQTYDVADGDGVYALEEHEQKDLAKITQAVHQTALEKGWWDGYDISTMTLQEIVNIGTIKIALMHTELSEALEELREGRTAMWTDETNKPEGMNIELADCVIRIMDLCAWMGIDLLAAIRVKSAYNAGRAYRHGGKLV